MVFLDEKIELIQECFYHMNINIEKDYINTLLVDDSELIDLTFFYKQESIKNEKLNKVVYFLFNLQTYNIEDLKTRLEYYKRG